MRYTPHDYQRRAESWIIDHPRCALFLDMGLGKTVITLSAIRRLIDNAEITRALIVAPKKVAESTWADEAAKWDHLRGLRLSTVLGTADKRRKAMAEETDIHVTSRDNFVWLLAECGGRLPYDCIVIDELTSFKSATSKRYKAMRLASPQAARVIGLTGTPAPNGLLDLWAQLHCIDLGQRLGKSLTRYRDTYFNLRLWDHIVVKATPKPGAEREIRGKIADICLTMQAKDYLTLPPMITSVRRVVLSADAMREYKTFERQRVLEHASANAGASRQVVAANAAALMGKLSQYANGAVYDDQHRATIVHRDKVDALAEIVECADSPVLVFYQYRSDIPAVLERLKGRKARVYEGDADLRAWNAGEIDVLMAHPASTAYGLNMQRGGHICVWLGTGWNLEQYQQACARLHRQGQSRPVIVYRLLTAGTVDERMAAAIDGKRTTQQALLDGLGDLMRQYGQQFAD